MIVVIFILLYFAIGASLGGYYSYLRFRDANDRYFDTDDATMYVALCTFLFPIAAPIIFAVYVARHTASR